MPQQTLLNYFQNARIGKEITMIPADAQKPGLQEIPTESEEQSVIIPSRLPRASIMKVLSIHIPQLKTITTTLLPVRYNDKFFKDCIENRVIAGLSRVVLYDSKPVGWIRCCIDPAKGETLPDRREIYIQALGILAPYRGSGLASLLLQCVLEQAYVQSDNTIVGVFAHVWETNTDAIEWYEKRGFSKDKLNSSYYTRLKPAGAWVMRKSLK